MKYMIKLIAGKGPGIRRMLAVCGIMMIILLYASCSSGENSGFINSLIRLSPNRYSDEPPTEAQMEEWKEDIRRYEAIIREKIDAAGSAVNYYKLLAEEYSRLGMHKLALENYQAILEIEPSNHVVLHSAGVSAGQYALSRPDQGAKTEYLRMAEGYYRRSIEVNPGYKDPYVGLAVLHVFEFDELDEGKRVVNQGLEIFPDNSRLLFVLARIALMENRSEDAVAIYNRIAETARRPDEKDAAIRNREALLSGE